MEQDLVPRFGRKDQHLWKMLPVKILGATNPIGWF